MARTPALQPALSDAWLNAPRLVGVKDLWSKAQRAGAVGGVALGANGPGEPIRRHWRWPAGTVDVDLVSSSASSKANAAIDAATGMTRNTKPP